MCMHEGLSCPRNCDCDCMNCIMGDDDDEYSEFDDVDGYSRNGAFDGFQVTSDADSGL